MLKYIYTLIEKRQAIRETIHTKFNVFQRGRYYLMKDIEDNVFNFKEVIGEFIKEEQPQLSQEDAIKLYDPNNPNEFRKKKKKKNSNDETETEDDEHLKRIKQELLESLNRVQKLAKQLFEEQRKEQLKVKELKVKDKERNISKEKNEIKQQNDWERNREE